MGGLKSGPGPGVTLLIAFIFILVQTVSSAPLYEDEENPDSDSQSAIDPNGCYYNFQHYREGERIVTNEPCLNCTCKNRIFMCYLRVCPFTKEIGQNCTIEKVPDQCCPIITCPEVPVHLLTSSTTTEHSGGGNRLSGPHHGNKGTAVANLDNNGCQIDGVFYPNGAQVPGSPEKPCELCYCIRNKTACIMQECALHVDGCRPVYEDGQCFPVRYHCDDSPYEEKATTTIRPPPTPGLVITTTSSEPLECSYNEEIFGDGARIQTEDPCEHCYCLKGKIACAVQECGAPLEKEGQNCTALPPAPGKCCPDSYQCDNDIVKAKESFLKEKDEKPKNPTKPSGSNDISLPPQGTIESTQGQLPEDQPHLLTTEGLSPGEPSQSSDGVDDGKTSVPVGEHTTKVFNKEEQLIQTQTNQNELEKETQKPDSNDRIVFPDSTDAHLQNRKPANKPEYEVQPEHLTENVMDTSEMPGTEYGSPAKKPLTDSFSENEDPIRPDQYPVPPDGHKTPTSHVTDNIESHIMDLDTDKKQNFQKPDYNMEPNNVGDVSGQNTGTTPSINENFIKPHDQSDPLLDKLHNIIQDVQAQVSDGKTTKLPDEAPYDTETMGSSQKGHFTEKPDLLSITQHVSQDTQTIKESQTTVKLVSADDHTEATTSHNNNDIIDKVQGIIQGIYNQVTSTLMPNQAPEAMHGYPDVSKTTQHPIDKEGMKPQKKPYDSNNYSQGYTPTHQYHTTTNPAEEPITYDSASNESSEEEKDNEPSNNNVPPKTHDFTTHKPGYPAQDYGTTGHPEDENHTGAYPHQKRPTKPGDKPFQPSNQEGTEYPTDSKVGSPEQITRKPGYTVDEYGTTRHPDDENYTGVYPHHKRPVKPGYEPFKPSDQEDTEHPSGSKVGSPDSTIYQPGYPVDEYDTTGHPDDEHYAGVYPHHKRPVKPGDKPFKPSDKEDTEHPTGSKFGSPDQSTRKPGYPVDEYGTTGHPDDENHTGVYPHHKRPMKPGDKPFKPSDKDDTEYPTGSKVGSPDSTTHKPGYPADEYGTTGHPDDGHYTEVYPHDKRPQKPGNKPFQPSDQEGTEYPTGFKVGSPEQSTRKPGYPVDEYGTTRHPDDEHYTGVYPHHKRPFKPGDKPFQPSHKDDTEHPAGSKFGSPGQSTRKPGYPVDEYGTTGHPDDENYTGVYPHHKRPQKPGDKPFQPTDKEVSQYPTGSKVGSPDSTTYKPGYPGDDYGTTGHPDDENYTGAYSHHKRPEKPGDKPFQPTDKEDSQYPTGSKVGSPDSTTYKPGYPGDDYGTTGHPDDENYTGVYPHHKRPVKPGDKPFKPSDKEDTEYPTGSNLGSPEQSTRKPGYPVDEYGTTRHPDDENYTGVFPHHKRPQKPGDKPFQPTDKEDTEHPSGSKVGSPDSTTYKPGYPGDDYGTTGHPDNENHTGVYPHHKRPVKPGDKPFKPSDKEDTEYPTGSNLGSPEQSTRKPGYPVDEYGTTRHPDDEHYTGAYPHHKRPQKPGDKPFQPTDNEGTEYPTGSKVGSPDSTTYKPGYPGDDYGTTGHPDDENYTGVYPHHKRPVKPGDKPFKPSDKEDTQYPTGSNLGSPEQSTRKPAYPVDEYDTTGHPDDENHTGAYPHHKGPEKPGDKPFKPSDQVSTEHPMASNVGSPDSTTFKPVYPGDDYGTTGHPDDEHYTGVYPHHKRPFKPGDKPFKPSDKEGTEYPTSSKVGSPEQSTRKPGYPVDEYGTTRHPDDEHYTGAYPHHKRPQKPGDKPFQPTDKEDSQYPTGSKVGSPDSTTHKPGYSVDEYGTTGHPDDGHYTEVYPHEKRPQKPGDKPFEPSNQEGTDYPTSSKVGSPEQSTRKPGYPVDEYGTTRHPDDENYTGVYPHHKRPFKPEDKPFKPSDKEDSEYPTGSKVGSPDQSTRKPGYPVDEYGTTGHPDDENYTGAYPPHKRPVKPGDKPFKPSDKEDTEHPTGSKFGSPDQSTRKPGYPVDEYGTTRHPDDENYTGVYPHHKRPEKPGDKPFQPTDKEDSQYPTGSKVGSPDSTTYKPAYPVDEYGTTRHPDDEHYTGAYPHHKRPQKPGDKPFQPTDNEGTEYPTGSKVGSPEQSTRKPGYPGDDYGTTGYPHDEHHTGVYPHHKRPEKPGDKPFKPNDQDGTEHPTGSNVASPDSTTYKPGYPVDDYGTTRHPDDEHYTGAYPHHKRPFKPGDKPFKPSDIEDTEYPTGSKVGSPDQSTPKPGYPVDEYDTTGHPDDENHTGVYPHHKRPVKPGDKPFKPSDKEDTEYPTGSNLGSPEQSTRKPEYPVDEYGTTRHPDDENYTGVYPHHKRPVKPGDKPFKPSDKEDTEYPTGSKVGSPDSTTYEPGYPGDDYGTTGYPHDEHHTGVYPHHKRPVKPGDKPFKPSDKEDTEHPAGSKFGSPDQSTRKPGYPVDEYGTTRHPDDENYTGVYPHHKRPQKPGDKPFQPTDKEDLEHPTGSKFGAPDHITQNPVYTYPKNNSTAPNSIDHQPTEHGDRPEYPDKTDESEATTDVNSNDIIDKLHGIIQGIYNQVTSTFAPMENSSKHQPVDQHSNESVFKNPDDSVISTGIPHDQKGTTSGDMYFKPLNSDNHLQGIRPQNPLSESSTTQYSPNQENTTKHPQKTDFTNVESNYQSATTNIYLDKNSEEKDTHLKTTTKPEEESTTKKHFDDRNSSDLYPHLKRPLKPSMFPQKPNDNEDPEYPTHLEDGSPDSTTYKPGYPADEYGTTRHPDDENYTGVYPHHKRPAKPGDKPFQPSHKDDTKYPTGSKVGSPEQSTRKPGYPADEYSTTRHPDDENYTGVYPHHKRPQKPGDKPFKPNDQDGTEHPTGSNVGLPDSTTYKPVYPGDDYGTTRHPDDEHYTGVYPHHKRPVKPGDKPFKPSDKEDTEHPTGSKFGSPEQSTRKPGYPVDEYGTTRHPYDENYTGAYLPHKRPQKPGDKPFKPSDKEDTEYPTGSKVGSPDQSTRKPGYPGDDYGTTGHPDDENYTGVYPHYKRPQKPGDKPFKPNDQDGTEHPTGSNLGSPDSTTYKPGYPGDDYGTTGHSDDENYTGVYPHQKRPQKPGDKPFQPTDKEDSQYPTGSKVGSPDSTTYKPGYPGDDYGTTGHPDDENYTGVYPHHKRPEKPGDKPFQPSDQEGTKHPTGSKFGSPDQSTHKPEYPVDEYGTTRHPDDENYTGVYPHHKRPVKPGDKPFKPSDKEDTEYPTGSKVGSPDSTTYEPGYPVDEYGTTGHPDDENYTGVYPHHKRPFKPGNKPFQPSDQKGTKHPTGSKGGSPDSTTDKPGYSADEYGTTRYPYDENYTGAYLPHKRPQKPGDKPFKPSDQVSTEYPTGSKVGSPEQSTRKPGYPVDDYGTTGYPDDENYTGVYPHHKRPQKPGDKPFQPSDKDDTEHPTGSKFGSPDQSTRKPGYAADEYGTTRHPDDENYTSVYPHQKRPQKPGDKPFEPSNQEGTEYSTSSKVGSPEQSTRNPGYPVDEYGTTRHPDDENYTGVYPHHERPQKPGDKPFQPSDKDDTEHPTGSKFGSSDQSTRKPGYPADEYGTTRHPDDENYTGVYPHHKRPQKPGDKPFQPSDQEGTKHPTGSKGGSPDSTTDKPGYPADEYSTTRHPYDENHTGAYLPHKRPQKPGDKPFKPTDQEGAEYPTGPKVGSPDFTTHKPGYPVDEYGTTRHPDDENYPGVYPHHKLPVNSGGKPGVEFQTDKPDENTGSENLGGMKEVPLHPNKVPNDFSHTTSHFDDEGFTRQPFGTSTGLHGLNQSPIHSGYLPSEPGVIPITSDVHGLVPGPLDNYEKPNSGYTESPTPRPEVLSQKPTTQISMNQIHDPSTGLKPEYEPHQPNVTTGTELSSGLESHELNNVPGDLDHTSSHYYDEYTRQPGESSTDLYPGNKRPVQSGYKPYNPDDKGATKYPDEYKPNKPLNQENTEYPGSHTTKEPYDKNVSEKQDGITAGSSYPQTKRPMRPGNEPPKLDDQKLGKYPEGFTQENPEEHSTTTHTVYEGVTDMYPHHEKPIKPDSKPHKPSEEQDTEYPKEPLERPHDSDQQSEFESQNAKVGSHTTRRPEQSITGLYPHKNRPTRPVYKPQEPDDESGTRRPEETYSKPFDPIKYPDELKPQSFEQGPTTTRYPDDAGTETGSTSHVYHEPTMKPDYKPVAVDESSGTVHPDGTHHKPQDSKYPEESTSQYPEQILQSQNNEDQRETTTNENSNDIIDKLHGIIQGIYNQVTSSVMPNQVSVSTTQSSFTSVDSSKTEKPEEAGQKPYDETVSESSAEKDQKPHVGGTKPHYPGQGSYTTPHSSTEMASHDKESTSPGEEAHKKPSDGTKVSEGFPHSDHESQTTVHPEYETESGRPDQPSSTSYFDHRRPTKPSLQPHLPSEHPYGSESQNSEQGSHTTSHPDYEETTGAYPHDKRPMKPVFKPNDKYPELFEPQSTKQGSHTTPYPYGEGVTDRPVGSTTDAHPSYAQSVTSEYPPVYNVQTQISSESGTKRPVVIVQEVHTEVHSERATTQSHKDDGSLYEGTTPGKPSFSDDETFSTTPKSDIYSKSTYKPEGVTFRPSGESDHHFVISEVSPDDDVTQQYPHWYPQVPTEGVYNEVTFVADDSTTPSYFFITDEPEGSSVEPSTKYAFVPYKIINGTKVYYPDKSESEEPVTAPSSALGFDGYDSVPYKVENGTKVFIPNKMKPTQRPNTTPHHLGMYVPYKLVNGTKVYYTDDKPNADGYDGLDYVPFEIVDGKKVFHPEWMPTSTTTTTTTTTKSPMSGMYVPYKKVNGTKIYHPKDAQKHPHNIPKEYDGYDYIPYEMVDGNKVFYPDKIVSSTPPTMHALYVPYKNVNNTRVYYPKDATEKPKDQPGDYDGYDYVPYEMVNGKKVFHPELMKPPQKQPLRLPAMHVPYKVMDGAKIYYPKDAKLKPQKKPDVYDGYDLVPFQVIDGKKYFYPEKGHQQVTEKPHPQGMFIPYKLVNGRKVYDMKNAKDNPTELPPGYDGFDFIPYDVINGKKVFRPQQMTTESTVTPQVLFEEGYTDRTTQFNTEDSVFTTPIMDEEFTFNYDSIPTTLYTPTNTMPSAMYVPFKMENGTKVYYAGEAQYQPHLIPEEYDGFEYVPYELVNGTRVFYPDKISPEKTQAMFIPYKLMNGNKVYYPDKGTMKPKPVPEGYDGVDYVPYDIVNGTKVFHPEQVKPFDPDLEQPLAMFVPYKLVNGNKVYHPEDAKYQSEYIPEKYDGFDYIPYQVENGTKVFYPDKMTTPKPVDSQGMYVPYKMINGTKVYYPKEAQSRPHPLTDDYHGLDYLPYDVVNGTKLFHPETTTPKPEKPAMYVPFKVLNGTKMYFPKDAQHVPQLVPPKYDGFDYVPYDVVNGTKVFHPEQAMKPTTIRPGLLPALFVPFKVVNNTKVFYPKDAREKPEEIPKGYDGHEHIPYEIVNGKKVFRPELAMRPTTTPNPLRQGMYVPFKIVNGTKVYYPKHAQDKPELVPPKYDGFDYVPFDMVNGKKVFRPELAQPVVTTKAPVVQALYVPYKKINGTKVFYPKDAQQLPQNVPKEYDGYEYIPYEVIDGKKVFHPEQAIMDVTTPNQALYVPYKIMNGTKVYYPKHATEQPVSPPEGYDGVDYVPYDLVDGKKIFHPDQAVTPLIETTPMTPSAMYVPYKVINGTKVYYPKDAKENPILMPHDYDGFDYVPYDVIDGKKVFRPEQALLPTSTPHPFAQGSYVPYKIINGTKVYYPKHAQVKPSLVPEGYDGVDYVPYELVNGNKVYHPEQATTPGPSQSPLQYMCVPYKLVNGAKVFYPKDAKHHPSEIPKGYDGFDYIPYDDEDGKKVFYPELATTPPPSIVPQLEGTFVPFKLSNGTKVFHPMDAHEQFKPVPHGYDGSDYVPYEAINGSKVFYPELISVPTNGVPGVYIPFRISNGKKIFDPEAASTNYPSSGVKAPYDGIAYVPYKTKSGSPARPTSGTNSQVVYIDEKDEVGHSTSQPHVPSGVPGEGSCLLNNKTFSNNSVIPPFNPCQARCRCVSSVIQCVRVNCPPPPRASKQTCSPIYREGSCCPTYACDDETTTSGYGAATKIPDSLSDSDHKPLKGNHAKPQDSNHSDEYHVGKPKPDHQTPSEPFDQVESMPGDLLPDDDYEGDDEEPYGPGTCRYAGKVYVSAQQIPRDDPCDFCFCFRSDIICLQQSCPPPIPGCRDEPIQGFCCPRYECHVKMATMLNVTSTTTTTTTTLPPHFFSHAYKGSAVRTGCFVQGKAYRVGQPIPSASGPCMDCNCGGNGRMKCEPKVCTPEPMIRKMIIPTDDTTSSPFASHHQK